jgi:hypothetical protein
MKNGVGVRYKHAECESLVKTGSRTYVLRSVNDSYNKSQTDVLFLNFILVKT